MTKPLGDLIDSLGVRTSDDDPDELISGAVVLLHVTSSEGVEHVRSLWSDGMSWITRRGLLEVALDADRVPPTDGDDA